MKFLSVVLLFVTNVCLADTAVQLLQKSTAPTFNPVSKQLPLTRWAWGISDDMNKELASRWGFAAEFFGDPKKITDPMSKEFARIKYIKENNFKMYVNVIRPFFDDAAFKAWYPTYPNLYCDFSQVNPQYRQIFKLDTLKLMDPRNTGPIYDRAAQITKDWLSQIQAAYPLTLVMNGGEYGFPLYNSAWYFCPGLSADLNKYPTSAAFTSYYKSQFEKKITDASHAAAPTAKYVLYPTDGNEYRGQYSSWDMWSWDWSYMKSTVDLPGSSLYYKQFNDGWTGTYDLLTQALNARGTEIATGYPLSFQWTCAGWSLTDTTKVSDDVHYEGFLKALYMAGASGAVAGYFSYTPTYTGDCGTTHPDWLRQVEILSKVHAQFSWLDDYIFNGTLLPGDKGLHKFNKKYPAYELNTGDANVRVIVRKRNDKDEWLLSAWAASGLDRNVTVTIPIAGAITVMATANAKLYKITPVTVVTGYKAEEVK